MRMLVLGQSDSSGNELPAAERHLAWPRLVADELPARLGVDQVELVHRVLNPAAQAQYEQFEAYLAEFDPDLVLLSTTHYAFTARTVKSHVRQRWGVRGVRLARRIENRFDALTGSGRVRIHINRAGRRMTKVVLGTAPISTYDQVVASYRAILGRLAREEDISVVVMGGATYSPKPVAPAVQAVIDRFKADIIAAVAQHRFVWIDTSKSLAGPDTSAMRLPDGIHRNVRGHRVAADMYLPDIVAAVNGHR